MMLPGDFLSNCLAKAWERRRGACRFVLMWLLKVSSERFEILSFLKVEALFIRQWIWGNVWLAWVKTVLVCLGSLRSACMVVQVTFRDSISCLSSSASC